MNENFTYNTEKWSIVSTAVQLLSQNILSLQVSTWPIYIRAFHFHKAVSQTKDKTKSELRIIVWPQIPLSSNNFCNVVMTLDQKSVKRLFKPATFYFTETTVFSVFKWMLLRDMHSSFQREHWVISIYHMISLCFMEPSLSMRTRFECRGHVILSWNPQGHGLRLILIFNRLGKRPIHMTHNLQPVTETNGQFCRSRLKLSTPTEKKENLRSC